MHARLSHLVILILALIASLAMAPAWVAEAGAQSLIDRRQPRDQNRGEARAISQDEAVSRAESRYRAKAVRVERVSNGDHVIYQIRLLNAEGKVWTVQVDAATGRMN